MRVVLLKPVTKVGQAGDVRMVADGYARNYLFPRRLATPATAEQLQTLNDVRQQHDGRAERLRRAAVRAQAELDGRHFTLEAKASEQGTLFAGVTAEVVAGILRAKGYDVTASMVKLPHPLKHVGEHQITVDFGDRGKAVIIVKVVPGVDPLSVERR